MRMNLKYALFTNHDKQKPFAIPIITNHTLYHNKKLKYPLHHVTVLVIALFGRKNKRIGHWKK